MSDTIGHSRPWLTEADRQAINAVLDSEMLAQGEVTAELEREMAAWVGASGGVATGSGTAALTLALLALEVGQGHEVLMPSYVCRSVMEAVLTVGAKPVLADVGADWVVTPETCAAHISAATRAIIVPHMYGIFADLPQFRSFGVPLIEDCAQAVAGSGERPVSGDVAVFSFQPTKCFTTGEGGMAVSARPDLVERLRQLRDGRSAGDGIRIFAPLSDIAAALGLSQLQRYASALQSRREIAARYRAAFEDLLPNSLHHAALQRSMFYRFPITVAGGVAHYQAAFASRGMTIRCGVDPLLHRLGELDDTHFPNTVRLYETTVSFPIYPAMSESQVQDCIAAVTQVFADQRLISAGAQAR